ncbi:MAG: hypothetical protein KC616_25605 [Myxococcales bacterium]|nr:hypothetical protein [Myxococcales bacterium]
MKRGPRICVKRDQESTVGRGCVLHAAHFRPELAAVVVAAAELAPPEVEQVWLVEGWRDIRDTPDRHETLDALDIVGTDGKGQRFLTSRQYVAWSQRVSSRLGDRYDVLAHDAGSGWHIHAEWDPK